MPARSEIQHPYQNNPATLSEEVVGSIFDNLPEEPQSALDSLRYLQGHSFGDIFTYAFQVLRMGELGWRMDIPEELRSQYGISETTLDSIGPENVAADKSLYDPFTGTLLIRSAIAASFVKQADMNGSSIDINDDIIDAHPATKNDLMNARAPREGIFIYDAEELEKQWQTENPILHGRVAAFIDTLAGQFTDQTILEHEHMDPQFMDQMRTGIRDMWQADLQLDALRTYAMFTPNPPELIEVPVQPEE